jgi:septal ring factor EnvC (AmiA/AmiB activator)
MALEMYDTLNKRSEEEFNKMRDMEKQQGKMDDTIMAYVNTIDSLRRKNEDLNSTITKLEMNLKAREVALSHISGARFNDVNVPPLDNGYSQAGTQGHVKVSNDELVRYHQPDRDGVIKITNIRQAALNFLNVIDANVPEGKDRESARECVRDAMMRANAAIVLNGRS